MHIKKEQRRKKPLRAALRSSLSRGSLMLQDFKDDVRGNFAVMFALASVPILGIAGLALEFTRYSMVNEGLTNALDAAGLAISQRAEAQGYDIGSLSTDQKNELKEYGKDFFYSNFEPNASVRNLSVDFIFSATTVKPQATGFMDTSLLRILGVTKFNMVNTTEITLQGAGRLELALVLDVTGSMGSSAGNGSSRMATLKEAVGDMMDTLYGAADDATNENVKVGVIPFNTVVNTGGDSAMDATWLDKDAESMYHGESFIHVEDPFDIDATRKVNVFELYDSIGNETSWKGCVESRPFPLDEMDTVPGDAVSASDINRWDDLPADIDASVYSIVADAYNNAPSLPYSASEVGRVENTRFVPYFYPDESECYYTCNYTVYSYTFPTVSDTGFPGYLYDSVNEDGDYESHYYNRYFVTDWQYTNVLYANRSVFDDYFAVVCQHRYNVAGWQSGTCADLPLTLDSDWTAIVNKTQATNAGQDEYRLRQAYVGIYDTSTNMYEGKYDLTLGLSEGGETAGQGPNRYCSTPILPMTTSKEDVTATIDALTPGGATNTAIGAIWGWRVLSKEAPFTEGVDTSVDTDWRKAVILMTDGQNNLAGLSGSHNGSIFDAYGYLSQDRLNLNSNEGDYEDEWDRKTIRICHAMQAAGIRVYTVGFSISAGSGADDMLKACASKPTGDNKTYYLATDGDALIEAFQDITEDLVNLHISG